MVRKQDLHCNQVEAAEMQLSLKFIPSHSNVFNKNKQFHFISCPANKVLKLIEFFLSYILRPSIFSFNLTAFLAASQSKQLWVPLLSCEPPFEICFFQGSSSFRLWLHKWMNKYIKKYIVVGKNFGCEGNKTCILRLTTLNWRMCVYRLLAFRRMSAGYPGERRVSEALVRMPQEQRQEDRALACPAQWQLSPVWGVTHLHRQPNRAPAPVSPPSCGILSSSEAAPSWFHILWLFKKCSTARYYSLLIQK